MKANAIGLGWKATCVGGLALLATLASDRSVGSASVDAASSYIVLPIVAQTTSYSSEITIYNPNAVTANLVVEYVGGTGTTSPGLRTCTPLAVAANRAVQFNVGAQCSLPGGSHFGMLYVHEPTSATSVPTPVHGYSRVSNPQGLGFSVPALPLNVFESGLSSVIGLKRKAAVPGFQTNCFVGSFEYTTYRLSLYDPSGNQIGRTIWGTVPANTLKRHLDVFAVVGAPVGDYENVRAEFAGYERSYGPPLIAFCTVQDNASFGADFRIAGATQPYDSTRVHRSVSSNAFYSYGNKHVYEVGYRTPDLFRCFLQSSQLAALEMVVLAYDASGRLVSYWGGNEDTDTGVSFENQVWPRRPWLVEVGMRGPTPVATYPLSYTLVCESGNGHAATGRAALESDDF